MHNFLKVLLLGTVLIGSYSFAQAPGFEAAWARATLSGYGNDSAKLGFSPPGAAGSSANSASSNLMVLSPEEAALTGATHYDVAADEFVTIVNKDSLETVAQSTENLRGLSTAEAALTGSTHVDVSTGEFSTHVGGAGAGTGGGAPVTKADFVSGDPTYGVTADGRVFDIHPDGSITPRVETGSAANISGKTKIGDFNVPHASSKVVGEASKYAAGLAEQMSKDATKEVLKMGVNELRGLGLDSVNKAIDSSKLAIQNTKIAEGASYADASKAAEEAVSKMKGGDLPPEALQDAIEKKLSDKMLPEIQKKYPELSADQAKEVADKAAKEQAAKEVEKVLSKTILSFNYIQYALLIAESLKGNEIDDATKEVTVKGAEPMQQSQGSQGGGASLAPLPSSEMAGTTIAGAASAMVALLDLGKIDLSLLSTDIEKPEEKKRAPAVRASSSASQADVSASEVQTQSESQAKKMNTQEQREIMHRRALLLSEWAAAALQIGEGSNAISSDFYARAAGFGAAASGAQGSMGGINTITDSDRFVLFELTRGAALSAVQLGLQGAENLNALDEVMEEPAPARTPGISASTSSSQ